MDIAAQNERPHRRWHQFGLRAFFAFITLVACFAAWVGGEMARRQGEEAAITELTGRNRDGSTTTVVDSRFDRLPPADINPLNPPRPKGSTGLVERLRNLNMFRRVVMFSSFPKGNTFSFDADDQGRILIRRDYKAGLKDDDMQRVKKLANLRCLWLEAHEITDVGLLQLNTLKRLEILWLQHTAITDAGLSVLTNFPELRDLDLSGTYVTDASVGTLAKCRKLKRLKLQNTTVAANGIATLQKALPDCLIEN